MENGVRPSGTKVFGMGFRKVDAARIVSGKEKTFSGEISIFVPPGFVVDDKPILVAAYFIDKQREKQRDLRLLIAERELLKAPFALLRFNLHGEISHLNDAAEELLGYSNAFIKRRKQRVDSLMQPGLRAQFNSWLKLLRESIERREFYNGGSDILQANKKYIWLDCNGEPVEIELTMRLQQVDQNPEISCVIIDRKKFILATDYKKQLAYSLLPPVVADAYLSADGDIAKISKEIDNTVIIFIDLEGSTEAIRDKDRAGIELFFREFYKAAVRIAPIFTIDIVKFIGDAVLATAAETNSYDIPEERANRSVQFAMSLVNWANLNGYKLRIGLDSGSVRWFIIPCDERQARLVFDMVGVPIHLAERLQSTAKKGEPESTLNSNSAIQISEAVFARLNEVLKGHFIKVKHDSSSLKGFEAGSCGSLPSTTSSPPASLTASSPRSGIYFAYRAEILMSSEQLDKAGKKIANIVEAEIVRREELAMELEAMGKQVLS